MIDLPSPVVLDACVLANFSLCDTLLRLAESPRLFEPRWSDEIIGETSRTLESKLGWPAELVEHFVLQLRSHFSDSWVSGYEDLLGAMTNDVKDRHVVAAAIHGGAPTIVTFNLRHFGSEHLAPWSIQAMHPQEFLLMLLQADAELVLGKLGQQASDRRRSLQQLLDILRLTVPDFAKLVAAKVAADDIEC